MLRLDKSRDYGNVTPPYQPPDALRAAHFDQDGRLFDQHGRDIYAEVKETAPPEPKTPPQPTAEKKVKGVKVKTGAARAEELVYASDQMTWPAFKKEALAVLGPSGSPNFGKAQLVELLKAAASGPATEVVEEAKDGDDPPATPKPAAEPAGKGVDLRAWGTGRKDYIWPEVKKAIKAKHSKIPGTRADAVDMLVDLGVIKESERRQDV
jgi:hypothetical protein